MSRFVVPGRDMCSNWKLQSESEYTMKTNASLYFCHASLLVIGMILLTPRTGIAQEANSIDYQVVLKSELQMVVNKVPQNIEAETKIKYTNVREGNNLKISFRETAVTVNIDDRTQMNMVMNDQFMEDLVGQQKVMREDAPEGLKALLGDSFGPVISELTLDDEGLVKKRKDYPTDNNTNIVEQIETARFLHSPFYADKAKWVAPAKFGIGNGGFAEGDLTYEVVSKDDDGIVTVKVTGELSLEGGKPPVKIVDGKVPVSGTQKYNPEIKAWESGELVLEPKFNMEVKGQAFAEASGKMEMTVSIED